MEHTTKYSLEHILNVTLKHLNLSQEDWIYYKHTRLGPIYRTKQILALLAYREGYSKSEISRFLGMSRSAALRQINTIRDEISIYKATKELVTKVQEEVNQLPRTQTKMVSYAWLSRSKEGILTASPTIPEKFCDYWIAPGSRTLPKDQFPQISYYSEPVKVRIQITIEEDETM